MTELSDRVGEVIGAETTEFVAQCYELYQSPPLGSLVKTGGNYGVIYQVITSSMDQGRHPIARGKDETCEEDVYRASPQLEKLLRSEFHALVVGHRESEKVFQYLPPAPAHIHGFVYRCNSEEIKEFSHSFDFLNMLINAHLPISTEEIVAAALRQMSQAQEDRRTFLVAAGKELALLLSGQFNQLKAILGRIRE